MRNFTFTVRVVRHEIFTGRNEVVDKVIFLHLFSFCSQGGGGSPLGRTPPARENPARTSETPLPGRTPPPDHADPLARENPSGPGRHLPRSGHQHMLNERLVRILLECILVCKVKLIISKKISDIYRFSKNAFQYDAYYLIVDR